MKFILGSIFISFLVFSSLAQAVDQQILLLGKCRAPQAGILFFSFGLQSNSTSSTPEHFVTGLMLQPEGQGRAYSYDFIVPEMGTLQPTDVHIHEGFIRLEFQTEDKVHRLTALQLQDNIHGYKGNWAISTWDGETLAQLPVDCTVPQPVWNN